MSGKLYLGKAPVVFAVCQIIVILFYGLFVEFGSGSNPHQAQDAAANAATKTFVKDHYPSF